MIRTPGPRNAILAEQSVRQALHEAEQVRTRGVCWSGVSAGPFVAMTEAGIAEEEARREVARNSPDAVLKRRALVMAQEGSAEAYAVLCAADRGDAGWQDRAEALAGAVSSHRRSY